MPTHIKNYNNISIKQEKFIKKALLYANPTAQQKIVTAHLHPNPYARLKSS